MSFEKHLPALADALRDVAASVGTDTMGLTLMFPNETTFSSNFHQDLGDLTKDPVLRDLLIRNSALRAAQAAVRADGVEKTAARLHLERGEVEAVWFENPAMDSDTSAVGPIRVGRKRRGLAPVVALTDERAANDHAEIARLLAGHGHTAGFTPEEIARAEAKRKVRFPEGASAVLLVGAEGDGPGSGRGLRRGRGGPYRRHRRERQRRRSGEALGDRGHTAPDDAATHSR